MIRHRILALLLSTMLILQVQLPTIAQGQPETEQSDAEARLTRLNRELASLHRVGDYSKAVYVAHEALMLAEEKFGANHPATLASVNNLAFFYEAQGQYNEAAPLYLRVLGVGEDILAADHPNRLTTLSNLALLYQKQGRYDEAERMSLRALKARESALGVDHPNTLTSVNNLALLYQAQGRYGEAEQLALRALHSQEVVLGSNHPNTLSSINNLALLYKKQGRYREAETLYLRALYAREVAIGSNHPNTLTTANNLAILYNEQGRYDEAEQLYLRALYAREAVLGADHPDTLLSINGLATLYQDQGRYSDAEPLFRRSRNTAEVVLGADHPSTMAYTNNLAALLHAQGKYDESGVLYLRALKAREDVLGAFHPDTLSSVNNLALLYKTQGRYGEAEPLYLRALSASERVLGKQHIERASYTGNYAALLAREARSQPAAIYFQKEAVNILQQARANMSELEASTQSAFLEKNAAHYETLQQWLIEAGRFAEAEQVGRMLKEQEYFEFIRRSTRGEDPRETLADLTPLESQWADQFAAWSERPNKIAVTLAALKTKQRSGDVLTALEETQLTDLQAQYDTAYADYKQQVNTWLASVRDLSDETIQAEARALEARFHDDLQGEIADIGDDVAALQLVAFDDSLHFFLITPRAFKHIEAAVARADLNEAIFAARRAVQPDPRTGFPDPDAKSKLQVLHDLLFAPVEQELADAGIETVMLNLQGAIRYVPFAALHDGDRYLTERYKLALFTPAARTRFETAADMSRGTGFGVTRSHTIEGLGTFSALPGVEAELAAILGSDATPGIISGSTDLDAAFTRASFADRLEEGRPVVHIASHFYMRAGNDADSFLLMGDGTALTLAEINEAAGLRFRGVELLTLSACSTALNSQGDFDVGSGTGAEVEGFGVLAQRKGAEAVLASLWDVADEATSDLMAELYANLSTGEMTKAEALQAAQLELLGNPATEHPYYWAPFILMGNWK